MKPLKKLGISRSTNRRRIRPRFSYLSHRLICPIGPILMGNAVIADMAHIAGIVAKRQVDGRH